MSGERNDRSQRLARKAWPLTNRRATLMGFAGAYLGIIQAACTKAAEPPVIDVTDPPFNADPTGGRNSTQAFHRASEAIMRAGGGVLIVPRGDYRVGMQTPVPGASSEQWSFRPEPIISISGCSLPVEIRGLGARLFCDDGLRFGSFNRANGQRLVRALPFTDATARATPYVAMISLIGNRGRVVVRDIELDGRCAALILGGPWNDAGIQIPASGIQAYNNQHLSIAGVTSRNHGLDGILIGWENLAAGQPEMPHRLSDCAFTGNGRQGLSWVGGNSLLVERCTFSRTGRNGVTSSPAAGIDTEAERSICHNASFIDCVIEDNAGVGVLAHRPSDNRTIKFTNCRISGSTNWAAWPASPNMKFFGCRFEGGVTNAYGDNAAADATRFSHCVFTAIPRKDGRAGSFRQNYLTAEINSALNVLFEECLFDSNGDRTAGIAYINGGAILTDCEFRQDGNGLAVIRGRFIGSTTIETGGTVDFAGARIVGQILLNGKVIAG